MWLLFYVMDSLSVKLLQEGKQAIQRQPFLHNANLPTSIPTDNHPSVSHREFEINYAKCHQHRRNYRRIHRHIHRRILVLRHLTESSKTFTTKCHNHRREYRRILVRRYLIESSKIFTTKCHNHRRKGNLSVTHITDRNTDGPCDFQSV